MTRRPGAAGPTAVERARLGGVIAAELGVVAALHSLARVPGFAVGWSDLDGWLDAAPFEDVVAALLLVTALVLAYWLLASTMLYLVLARSGRPVRRGLRRLTVAPVRRLVHRALALSIAASAVTGPAWPAGAHVTEGGGSAVVQVESRSPSAQPARDDGHHLLLPPHLGEQAAEQFDPAEEAARVRPVATSARHTVRVSRGDHLWSISEQHLGRVLGRADLGEHEIARYWVQVIEANRATIRSGNPDLIYPGELIELPPVLGRDSLW